MALQKQNKMATMPVAPLVLSMGTPMMVSMLVQALYNIIDSMYVSQITGEVKNLGDLAVAALGFVFPIQLLISSLGVGTGVGVGTCISKSLGEKNHKKANKAAGNAIPLYAVYTLITALFGILGSNAFLASQTADSIVISLGVDYMQLVTIGSLGFYYYFYYERLIQATGHTGLAMLGQLVGAVTNIILDPIFIFGYCGLPAMGIKGAALATVAGQWLSAIVLIIFHVKCNREIRSAVRYLKPEKEIIAEIYKVGVPAIIMQSLNSFMTYGVNIILSSISTTAVTAFGIYYKIQSFIYMPVFGLSNAVIPIVSFNYGMRSKERFGKAIRWGIFVACTIMVIGTLACQFVTASIVDIFTLSSEARSLSMHVLRVITIGFPLAGASIILQSSCQALGNGMYSLIISLMRNLVGVLPLALLCKIIAGDPEQWVWIAFPIAELLSLSIAIYNARKLYKRRCQEIESSSMLV